MRGEVVDEMIDRARRIVADERNQTHLGKWAEALLAERAKREEAERHHADAQDYITHLSARVADLEVALGIVRAHYGSSSVDALLAEHGVLAGGSDES